MVWWCFTDFAAQIRFNSNVWVFNSKFQFFCWFVNSSPCLWEFCFRDDYNLHESPRHFLDRVEKKGLLEEGYEPNPTFHCFFPLRFDLMDPPRARSVPSRGDANPFWSDKAKSEHFLQSARPMDLPPEGIMTLQSSPGPRSRLRELQMCLPEKVAVIKRQERCRWMSDPSQWAWSFEDAGEAS